LTKIIALLAVLVLPFAAAAAQSHPRLLWSAGDVSVLRARAQGTHQAIWAALKGGTDTYLETSITSDGTVHWSDGRASGLGDRRDIGTALIVFAFVWQIDGGAAYWNLAHGWLMQVAGWGDLDLDGTKDLLHAHLLAGVAFAYDVLYPNLTDADRASIRQVLASNAQALMQAGQSGIGQWWEHEYLQNHNWVNHAGVGLAALAVEGEVSGSDTWRNYAAANAAAIIQATKGIADGTWHEGPSYLDYGYLFHLPFVEALYRGGHEDLRDFPLLRGLASLKAHGQIPEMPFASILTYGDFFGFNSTEGMEALRFAASRYRDPLAQAAADRQAAGMRRGTYAPEISGQVFEFLFHDPSIQGVDLHQEPLDWFGSDLQAAIFRSSWDPGATLFALKSGVYGGHSVWQRLAAGDTTVGTLNFGHDHADDNGFYLYGNGAWLAPEAQGYGATVANFSDLHNVLLVDGQGQLMEQGLTDGSDAYSWFSSRESSIAFHGSTDDFAYAVGEGARLYPASFGLQRWDRHALFLDRRYVLLRDAVQSSQAHAFGWLCHFLDGASQSGTWIRGSAKNGQALGVAVVAPSSWTLSVTQQSPSHLSGLDPDGVAYAATVTAPAAHAVTFLTALVPIAAASWDSRPAVAALDASAPEAGLVLEEGSRLTAALFSDSATGSRRAGDYHLEGLAGVTEYDAGTPTRALLVEANLLEDSSRALLSQDGTASVLEANGLSSDVVSLSGDSLGEVKIFAPRATQLLWHGTSIPFQRQGDFAVVAKGTVATTVPNGIGTGPTQDGPGAGPTAPTAAASAIQGCTTGGTAGLAALGFAAPFALLRRRGRRATALSGD
jgi:hypothetical protein